ncbi:hypothetical protein GXP70_03600 [Paenibacillus lycopersici]|uniref:BtrH N-terminal domain-containing protein n=1 Tax=Paenibacillus lycopersici TaxID=2704462 RepID=A0A6C0G337_9BACL|nr:hypothetical protein [Paenibacillus lycopersici]QHT59135.1 hypothetical protein GXP70_03600 [Paenibacillus lycopersici]
MGSRRLTGLALTRESLSYIDAMHAVLAHCGWFGASKAMLAGMTINGFRFSVDRKLSADSWHAYNWIAEHFLAADFIGVASSQKAGFSFAPTFPLYRKHAVAMIKEAIDNGIGAVFWKDDFVVAAGYDDEAGCLLYADGSGAAPEELKPLPYDEFGCNETPYWYYQTFDARIPLDELEIYRESFMQAIFKWETHDLMLSPSDYACGKQVYEAFIKFLDADDGCHAEARPLLWRYAAAKRDLADYAAELAKIWPDCLPIADCYAGVAERFAQLSAELSASDTGGSGPNADRMNADVPAVPLLREAAELENRAVQLMKSMMRERLHNRFGDISLR